MSISVIGSYLNKCGSVSLDFKTKLSNVDTKSKADLVNVIRIRFQGREALLVRQRDCIIFHVIINLGFVRKHDARLRNTEKPKEIKLLKFLCDVVLLLKKHKHTRKIHSKMHSRPTVSKVWNTHRLSHPQCKDRRITHTAIIPNQLIELHSVYIKVECTCRMNALL